MIFEDFFQKKSNSYPGSKLPRQARLSHLSNYGSAALKTFGSRRII